MIGKPFVATLEDRQYFGIRFSAPYRGMFSQVAENFKTLEQWIRQNPSVHFGPRFLRYLVIDMGGTMELEIGAFGTWTAPLSGEISTGTMPGGRYATLIYQGLGLAANKALIDWIRSQGLKSDNQDLPNGDGFACRYEAYLSDPKLEPRKKHWDIELAIKLKD